MLFGATKLENRHVNGGRQLAILSARAHPIHELLWNIWCRRHWAVFFCLVPLTCWRVSKENSFPNIYRGFFIIRANKFAIVMVLWRAECCKSVTYEMTSHLAFWSPQFYRDKVNREWTDNERVCSKNELVDDKRFKNFPLLQVVAENFNFPSSESSVILRHRDS
jgi:hypothetical protein